MAHLYAGILGPLALLTSLARGLLHGGEADSVIRTAWLSLVVFAAMGYVIGWIADRTVEESVHGRIAAELAAHEETKVSARASAESAS